MFYFLPECNWGEYAAFVIISSNGGLSLHVWVGWIGEINNWLIAAAWGALYKLTSDLTQ